MRRSCHIFLGRIRVFISSAKFQISGIFWNVAFGIVLILQFVSVNNVIKSLNVIGSIIQKKFSNINQKIDSNFNNTILAHNLFLESCHRIQLEEPQLETKITIVLETLLSLIANKYGQITFVLLRGKRRYLIKSHFEKVSDKTTLFLIKFLYHHFAYVISLAKVFVQRQG